MLEKKSRDLLFQGLRDQQAHRSLEGRSNKIICDMLEINFSLILKIYFTAIESRSFGLLSAICNRGLK
jgi:hypothetical protein